MKNVEWFNGLLSVWGKEKTSTLLPLSDEAGTVDA